MPDGEGCSLWGNTPSVVKAGLPNITGRVTGAKEFRITLVSGCFTQNDYGASGQATTTGNNYHSFEMNASASNPIYGSANTVRPPSIGVVFCIKY